jgi:hypothetical protein
MNRAPLLLLFLFILSCKTASVVTKTEPAPPPPAKMDASVAVIDSIRHHQLQFEYLSGKAKVHVVTEKDETDFTANIRMRRDSAIWVSISPALGVEAVRLLMTVDSIRVIERLAKKRYSRDYGFFKSYTSLPVSFSTMQDLIIGNPLFLKDHYRVSARDSLIAMTVSHENTSDSLLINRNYLPVFQLLTDSASSMSAINDQFDIQYTPPFSLWRKIMLQQKGVMTIEITFSRIKLNEPVKFPFRSEE